MNRLHLSQVMRELGRARNPRKGFGTKSVHDKAIATRQRKEAERLAIASGYSVQTLKGHPTEMTGA
jgi:hypothetical protein